MVMGLTGGPDPHSGSNVNRIDGDLHFWNIHPDVGTWADPDNYWISNEEWQIDRIFRDQVREMDEEARWQMFADYQRLFVEEAPLVYTVQALRLYAKKAELKLSLIHISEPTRLLSISYAVFCLTNKNKIT